MSSPIGIGILIAVCGLLGCILLPLVIYFLIRARRELNEKLTLIAESTGLENKRLGYLILPSIKGTYRGRKTKIILCYLDGNIPYIPSIPVTTITMTFPTHNIVEMIISNRSLGDKIKMFHWDLVSTGDEKFDDEFTVFANDKTAISNFLSDDIRAKLIAVKPFYQHGTKHLLFGMTPTIFRNVSKIGEKLEKYASPKMTVKLHSDRITFKQYEREVHEDDYVTVLDVLSDIADGVEHKRQGLL